MFVKVLSSFRGSLASYPPALQHYTRKTRKPGKTYNMSDIVGGTCRRIPGPPAFLVNVVKLGVAWGRV